MEMLLPYEDPYLNSLNEIRDMEHKLCLEKTVVEASQIILEMIEESLSFTNIHIGNFIHLIVH